jgi:hypothetical protein
LPVFHIPQINLSCDSRSRGYIELLRIIVIFAPRAKIYTVYDYPSQPYRLRIFK